MQSIFLVAMGFLPAAPSRSRFGRARPVGRGMSRRERCDFVMCCYLGLYKNKEGGN